MNRIVLLGTGGGPKIWAKRSQPSSAIIINDSVYIIDTGDGICTQLAKAHIDIKKIKAIFITHNHSDHVDDIPLIAKNTGATVVSIVETAEDLASKGCEKTIGCNIGGTVKLKELELLD